MKESGPTTGASRPVVPSLLSISDSPEPAPARGRIFREILVALSLANLCFICAWFSPLYEGDQGYSKKLPVTDATLLALAVNIVWSFAVIFALMRSVQRARARPVQLLSHLLFVALLLFPLDFLRSKVFHIPDYQVVAFLKRPIILCLAVAATAALLWQHRRVACAVAVLAAILSPLALFNLIKIGSLTLGIQHFSQHTSDPALAPLGPSQEGRPRVLWIIFDETDQRIAFDQRPASLHLTEFDRLRAQSLCATNAYPPADSTMFSMPQLISGRAVSNLMVKNASDLELTLADSGEVVDWSKIPSVFSSARDLGFNTALVGWAHPYRRVLGPALNYCQWYPVPSFEPARANKFGEAMIRQITCLAGTLHTRQQFAEICRSCIEESIHVVTNDTYGLILLHLPPPHRPGVYLPDKDSFTIFGMPKVTGYFNNLALADSFLGRLRRAMEATGDWNRTWVLLSADHSWRESQLYDHHRDMRVPFLLKAPDQARPVIYSPRIGTLLTRDLILGILRGDIANDSDAVAWLDKHATTTAVVQLGDHEEP